MLGVMVVIAAIIGVFVLLVDLQEVLQQLQSADPLLLLLGSLAFLSGLVISDSPFGKKAVSDVVLMRDTFLSLFFFDVFLRFS